MYYRIAYGVSGTSPPEHPRPFSDEFADGRQFVREGSSWRVLAPDASRSRDPALCAGASTALSNHHVAPYSSDRSVRGGRSLPAIRPSRATCVARGIASREVRPYCHRVGGLCMMPASLDHFRLGSELSKLCSYGRVQKHAAARGRMLPVESYTLTVMMLPDLEHQQSHSITVTMRLKISAR